VKTTLTQFALLTITSVVGCVAAPVWADESTESREAAEDYRAQLLAEMQSLAQQTKVSREGRTHQLKLADKPIFRYDDQPRRFIDATMWVWTDGGRPVAFQKIEAVEYGDTAAPNSRWQFCFASTAQDRLVVDWSEKRNFRSTEPGIAFAPLSAAPAVAEGSIQRKRQARDLARQFTGRIVTSPKTNTVQQMRLLTTPLFEYIDPTTKEFRGSVFGLSTNGTNPDVLIVLEAREEQVRGGAGRLAWHFAPARMTCCEVTLAFADAKVWQVDWVNGTEAPFATWTFFSSVRQSPAVESTP
jgi:hypothetical protein